MKNLIKNKPVIEGGWELIFAKRPSDLFVVKHARMKW